MREDYLRSDDEHFSPAEKEFEKALRPLSFGDFTGQEKVVENIKIFVKAAKLRGEPLDHV
ncbi:MAG: Holliday junction branch migration DNA helicase RuvB, partial [Cyclobacteriaceae bacterium]